MNRKLRTTNLWLIVEQLQLRLDKTGLSHEVVDETITKSLSALVDAKEERPHALLLSGRMPTPAQA